MKAGISDKIKTQADLLNLFSAKEDYLKVLLGTYGCVHFQDRLKTEFVENTDLDKCGDDMHLYLSESLILILLNSIYFGKYSWYWRLK